MQTQRTPGSKQGRITCTFCFIHTDQEMIGVYPREQFLWNFHLLHNHIYALIIYMKKFLHADWLRACQLIQNSAKTWNFFSAESWNWVQKLKIKLIDRKVANEKLTDGQSNLLFSNQAHALDGAIFPDCVIRVRSFCSTISKFFHQSAWRNFFMYIINR